MISFVGSYSVPLTICPLDSVGFEKTKDQLLRMDQLRIANLRRNEPGTFSANYETVPVPSQSWKEKCSLLKTHFSQNVALYKESGKALLKFIAVLGLVIVVAAVAYPVINRHLESLKQDILLGRLQYTKYPFDKVEMDYYYVIKASLLGIPSFFALSGLAVFAFNFYEQAEKLKLSEFYKDPTRLICHVTLNEETSSTEIISNEVQNGKVLDPISLVEIKSEWIHAPRFIKVGKYSYSLNTLIRRLFTTLLDENNLIQNPLGNWHITKPEQEKLRKNLCDLLLLEPKDLEKYWDPYFCDMRKPYLSLSKDPRLEAASEEDRAAVMQDILFEQDLSDMVPNWNTYNADEKAYIKSKIAPDYFADKRIIRFLSDFDLEVLSLEINLNDDESFKLQDLLDECKNRTYQF